MSFAALSLSRVAEGGRRFFSDPEGEVGAALLEFTLLGPLLIVAAIYVMDFGLIFFTKMEVRDAAMAGAQYAIITNGYDPSAITSAAQKATKFTAINVSPSQFCGCPAGAAVNFCSASCDVCNTGTCSKNTQGLYVQVQVVPSATYQPLIPFGVLSGSVDVSATSTVRIR